MRHGILALTICCSVISVFAQDAACDPFLAWMDQIAQQQRGQRESTIAQIRTTADAERRQKWVRAKLLELIGGLPDYHGPLNARTTGRIANSSYTLEKVIFESLPVTLSQPIFTGLTNRAAIRGC